MHWHMRVLASKLSLLWNHTMTILSCKGQILLCHGTCLHCFMQWTHGKLQTADAHLLA